MYSSSSIPPLRLGNVQALRRQVLVLFMSVLAVALLFVCSIWSHTHPLIYATIEHIGILLIFVCIFGRSWCALFIGGNKKATLIETGPYSLVRNPLYVFTLVGAAGVGAQTSSIVVIAFCVATTTVVFVIVIRREEQFLLDRFGAPYEAYLKRVPRFIPSFKAYQSEQQLTINLRLVRRTFIEACYFLVAIPAIDAIELAREYGWLPELIHLP
ncbi:isoprenylcysteine carboxylmethyltransferase family protein [Hyphomicrobium sp. CS1BSMeth3]|uniref:methyltransferase family protein n=1 Tax=Hyphomicrobium sp. CS1BSMeth3 TaxID=1892844 RepID=UPI0009319A25|nr:isoprenylcysteine carboxylmethyltransferase family protein [Hyphomicrobium sp. CS1BSMeth3]